MCQGLALLFMFSTLAPLAGAADTALAHMGAASQALDEERFGEAANEYQKALEANPHLLPARRDLAVCRFELRQYESAKELFSELLKHQPTNLLAHYYLGRINLIEGELGPAITHFLSIVKAHSFRDERYFLGMAYFKTAAWESCVKILQEAIQENPRDFRSHQLLARALQKLGRRDMAEREFSETRKLLSYYAEGSQALKRCSQVLSNNTAEEVLKICRPLLDTDDVDKLAALGTVFGNAGFFTQAEDAWKRAAFLDPDSAEIRYDLAITCFHLKNPTCARDNAKAAIQARAEFPEANVLYALVLYTLGADAEALPALRRAHALSPQDSAVRTLLSNELMLWAEHYAKAGNSAEARNLLSELDGSQPVNYEQEYEERRLALQRLLDGGQQR